MKALIPLLLLTIAPILHAQDLSKDDTASLINRLAESRMGQSIQTDFREEKRLAMMEKPIVETGELSFLPPNLFRREVAGKSLTVCDGKTLWIYYPSFKEAEKYTVESSRTLRESLAAMTSGLGLQDVTKTYTVSAKKTPEGYFLELIPRSGALRKSVSRITLTLTQDLQARRLAIENPNGESSVITFSNERKARLSVADFTFQPPAGTNISEPLAR